MRYCTEDNVSGYFSCEPRMVASKAQELASKYFAEATEDDTYYICIFDFEERTHEILEFKIERSIKVTGY